MIHSHNPDSWSLLRCAREDCEEFKKLKYTTYVGHTPIDEIKKNASLSNKDKYSGQYKKRINK